MSQLATSSFLSPVVASALRRAIGASLVSLAIAGPAHALINVNKTFTPDAVAANQPSKVTFYFLNNGIANATALAFTDTLPAGMFVAPTPNVVTNCGGTLTAVAGATSVSFSGGTVPMAVGTEPGQCDMSFDVVVPSANVLINAIPVGAVTTSQGSNTQAAEATLNVTGLGPIAGQKVFTPNFVHGYLPQGANPPVNGKSTVTITLNNPNSVALTNVTFTDNLPSTTHPTAPVPAGGLVVSPVPNGSTTCGGTFVPVAGAKSVTLSGGTIPAFGSCNVKFDVVAESPTVNAQGNITNTIPMGAVTSFEGPTNASFSAAITRQTGGNLVKAFSPTTIDNNGTALLTITVRNFNANTLNNIAFTDPLPAGMTIGNPAQPAFNAGDCQNPASTIASGFTVTATPGSSSIVVSGGSLVAAPNSANATQCTIRVNVTATNGGTGNLALLNTIPGGTWDGTIPFPAASGTLTVRPTSLVTGTKAFVPATVFQGQTSVGTIVLTNASGVALSNFGFTDNVTTTMGGGITIAAAPAPANDCGMSPGVNMSASVLHFTGGSLGAGASCTITFTVQTLVTTSTGNHTNTIAVNGVVGTPPAGDPVRNLIAISGTLNVVAPATASKAFNPSSVPAGTDSLLTITVTRPNNAPAWAGFTITDTLPAGHTISPVAATPAGNACVGTLTANAGESTITFTTNTPPANNTSCTIRVNVRTPSGTAGTATNTIPPGGFQVTFSGGGSYSNTANINANITRVTASVSLTKSFDPAVVDLLGESTMFLRIVNTAGNALNLTGVNLQDNLPAGLVIAAVPNALFTGTGCTLGTLTAPAGGTTITLTNASVQAGRICTIQVLTQALAAGNLINQVPAGALTSTQNVTNIEPVAATVTSTGLSHLTVTKTDGITRMRAGGTTTYTVVVSNGTGVNVADVAGATFTDTPPAGMTFTSWSCVPSLGAICTPNGTGPINDSVTIPKGGSITYTINALLAADYALANVQNCALITPPASVVDPDPSDNQACDTDDIERGLRLRKVWVNAIVDDAITVATTGLANNASVGSTSTGNNSTVGTQVFNLAGGTVVLPAETFGPGSQANYTTTVACTGATPSSTTPGPNTTFTMPNADVVCTYTNTRVSRNITLRKQWVNALVDDAITVATTGLSPNPSVTSTSTGNNLTTGTTQSVVPGGAVTLPAETFTTGSQANYTTTVACTGVTPSSNQPGATFTMPDGDVVCTYTNARAVATLQLRKTWISAFNGNTVTLSASGFANGAAAGFVSTAQSANETDAGVAVQVSAGEVGTIAEGAIGGPTGIWLSPSLTCTGNANPLVGNVLTVSPSDTAIVCTITNQRLPPAPPPDVRPVPVNTPLGFAMMVLMLAAAGAYAMRRRHGGRRR